MFRQPVRLRTPFAEVIFVRRDDPRALNAASRRHSVKLDLDRWFDEPRSRAALLELAGLRDRMATEAVVHRARNLLVRALDRGDLVALESRIRRVIMNAPGANASIGPEEPAPLGDDFLWALVFDSSGAPLPDALGVTFDALDRGKPRFENLRLRTGGAGVPTLPQGGPLSYDLRFTVPDDTVPATADPVGPPRFDLANVNTKGPLGDPVLVTRRELATKKQTGALDVNNVFQLRRREAEVIEFEHFHDGSAVFLPGPAPESVYREGVTERPLGIDVLSACLRFAQDLAPEQMVITGHDANVSQQRADCTKALLVGDDASRETWIAVAVATAVPEDVIDLLRWAAGEFGWDCDPDAPKGRLLSSAIQELKIHYNADVRANLFPVVSPHAPLLEDGVFDAPAWGALFDCYMRAIRPVAGARTTPLPSWATYPEGKESTRTGANAGRPQGKHPFVVLGSNGPGNAPITIAAHGAMPDGTGDPNLAFTVFQHVNPQYRVGVDPEFPGQALNVPDDWADNLAAAGYTVERDPLPPPPPPGEPGPPPLAAPGPLAVGCGAHHLTTPFESAENRRTSRRHAEIAFFEPGAAVTSVHCGPGLAPCSSAKCELYDPREYDFSYVRLGSKPAVTTLRIWLQDRDRQRMPHAPYRIRVGNEVRTGTATSEGLAKVHGVTLRETLLLEWGEPPADDVRPSGGLSYRYSRILFTTGSADHRLHNLAYEAPTRKERLALFLEDYSDVNAPPRDAIRTVHRNGTPSKRPPGRG